MKKQLLFISSLILASSAFAVPPTQADDNTADRPQPPLSGKEKESLDLAQKWMDAPEKPRITPDGVVTYLFGVTIPTVFCTPLYNTDVQLEAGEKVRENGVHIGDTVRWIASPAVSGPDDALVTHILIKPKDVGLTTTLDVMTDRRTYHFILKSYSDKWTPLVGFEYPQNIKNAWENYQTTVAKAVVARTIPETQQDMSTLDFGYEMAGTAPWKPLRVYNDGVKTYIQMPDTMAQTEAPALLVIGEDKKEQIVNYRLLGDRYVVDQIFRKAELVAGVGRKQTKILITKGKK